MNKISFIHTHEEKCQGCNKCIYCCPTSANKAFFDGENGKVFIKEDVCISCGECISVCDHDARDYMDDTEYFFRDLAAGEAISVVVAPSARFNIPNFDKVLGYLKQIGVRQIYDVSYGADICTWGHVKAIKEGKIDNIIAQPCPVIVCYIEKYYPTLLEKLSPIQSPVVCLGTYLKKYLGKKEKIMFLSPCIGKKWECESEHTNGVLEYNVTYDVFMKHLEREQVDIEGCLSEKFDELEGSIGFTFPRPGGLAENIRYHFGENLWIKQVEGIDNVTKYFDEYAQDIEEGRPVPRIVDALNCEQGCNVGTGTSKNARQNEIDFVMNEMKSKTNQADGEKLMKHFDEQFVFEDFCRIYTDRSIDCTRSSDVDMERAFLSLGKVTEEDRNINCFCCGYGNCYDFVYDLAQGYNDRNNCRHFLLNKFKKISYYDELTGVNSRHSYREKVSRIKGKHPGFVGIVYVDINGLKETNDTKGHKYGDMLITACADLLREVFGNKIYRVGGDEFVILDTEVKEEIFLNKVGELRVKVQEREYEMLSLGVACSHTRADFDQRLEEADRQMYLAKQEYYHTRAKANRRNT